MDTQAETSELTWPVLLETLLAAEDLTAETAAWAMGQLMSGELSDAQIAGFLIALRAKGESAQELVGLSSAMMDKALPAEILSLIHI